MRTFVIMLLASIAAPAVAQQVMDGSDKAVDGQIVKQISDGLAKVTKDPYSAQIKDLRPSPSDGQDTCGQVNLKNGFGAYTGFQPFIVYAGTLYLQNAEQCR